MICRDRARASEVRATLAAAMDTAASETCLLVASRSLRGWPAPDGGDVVTCARLLGHEMALGIRVVAGHGGLPLRHSLDDILDEVMMRLMDAGVAMERRRR